MKKGTHPNSHIPLAEGRAKNAMARKRYSYDHIAQVVAYMMRGRFTHRQLIMRSGASQTSCFNLITAFHSAGCIHISSFSPTRNGNLGAAVYEWGFGDDAVKTKKDDSIAAKSRRLRRERTASLERAWRMPTVARFGAGMEEEK